MPLLPGTQLGPYEITATLGAGGMGEVYRARDSRLGRDVAIKVLPQDVSFDQERLHRSRRICRRRRVSIAVGAMLVASNFGE